MFKVTVNSTSWLSHSATNPVAFWAMLFSPWFRFITIMESHSSRHFSSASKMTLFHWWSYKIFRWECTRTNWKCQKVDWGIRLFFFPSLSLPMACAVQRTLSTFQWATSFQVFQRPCTSPPLSQPSRVQSPTEGLQEGPTSSFSPAVCPLSICTAPFDTGLTTGLMSVVADSPTWAKRL